MNKVKPIINKVEVQCVCKRRHVVKIDAKKEHPCRCGSGIAAKSIGESVMPWSMHAPDRYKRAGCKPFITKWFWSNGLKLRETSHLAMP